jgi:hypothetical protein
VVVSWPEDGHSASAKAVPVKGPPVKAPPVKGPANPRARAAGIAGALLLVVGIALVSFAFISQHHAPQPSASAAGLIGALGPDPSLPRSVPVRVDIPAINVDSKLLHLGVNADGTIQVPSLTTSAQLAAWYKYSPTPGQIGTSIIEGHVDDLQGPAVFFRLGALRPGDGIEVTLADGVTALFRVTGVREFLKSGFPADTVYGTANYAALRLITCGGAFDYATGHYLSSTVVFASLASARR